MTKVRKNKKYMLLFLEDKLGQMKRGKIEAVNDILMSVGDIDHSRHPNPIHAIMQVRSGRAVYSFLQPQNFKVKPNRITA